MLSFDFQMLEKGQRLSEKYEINWNELFQKSLKVTQNSLILPQQLKSFAKNILLKNVENVKFYRKLQQKTLKLSNRPPK